MLFINKINLVFYIWTFLVFSVVITHIHAHGGVDDGHEDDSHDSGDTKAPSVFANEGHEKHGTLAEGNVPLAFGLTVMAALASALGSLTPFLDLLFPYIPFLSQVKITESKAFIAGSLSFSSGILLSLTLGDLFPEAAASFSKSRLFNRKYSALVAASIFILTILLIMVSKVLVKKYKKRNGSEADNDAEEKTLNQNESPEEKTLNQNEPPEEIKTHKEVSAKNQDDDVESDIIKPKDAKRFKSLGTQIAIALAIHNFPEGLASFATTLSSERIGIIFAIALTFHKIPEGLMISLPIYYATGSRLLAFGIAATVGVISQMLGAVLGYVLFVTVWNDAVSGVLFSMVTAALLYAILHGMLPMAHHYDPKDKYVTYYTFVGLIFFAIISSIFSIAE